MRILINYPHNRLTGVNTHSYTMAIELRAQGHDVDAYMDYLDKVEDKLTPKLKELGNYYLADNIPDVNSYDLVILVYYHTVYKFKDFKDVRKVFIGHSLHEEASLPNVAYIDSWYYISEFGANYLANKYKYPVQYIPQFIDLLRYKQTKTIRTKLKNILLIDSRKAEEYSFIFKRVCEERNLNLKVISTKTIKNLIWDVRTEITWADLVVGYGRTAIEAMSMGRNTIVYGVNGGDGLVTKKNIREIAQRNFSGWSTRIMNKPPTLTKEQIGNELDSYAIHNIQIYKEYIKTISSDKVSEYLKLKR